MKRLFSAVIFCFAAFTLSADQPAPPSWLWGQWIMEYEGETMTLVFLQNDILLDGQSILEMIGAGYVTAFVQHLDDMEYSVQVQYADGSWWQETFPRPTITSSYTDQSHEEGQTENLLYIRVQ